MAKKVLVVDDDENTVRFLSAALEENGYQPIGALNGKEGLEKIEASGQFDAVLCDLAMPMHPARIAGHVNSVDTVATLMSAGFRMLQQRGLELKNIHHRERRHFTVILDRQ